MGIFSPRATSSVAGAIGRASAIFTRRTACGTASVLPEGYARFVGTLAPAWEADKRPIYGAFFWINGIGTFPVPKDAYYMSGAGGQTTLIIPSHDLVVVRMGHYKGQEPGNVSFRKALGLLMEA